MGVLGLRWQKSGHTSVPETALPVAAPFAVTISRSRPSGQHPLVLTSWCSLFVWCLLVVYILFIGIRTLFDAFCINSTEKERRLLLSWAKARRHGEESERRLVLTFYIDYYDIYIVYYYILFIRKMVLTFCINSTRGRGRYLIRSCRR